MTAEKPRLLDEKTVEYGLSAIDFCAGMPENLAGRHVAGQLLRSATSVAANYAEASEAESPQDFVHKLKLVQKELKESMVWLRFAARIDRGRSVEALLAETRELLLMVSASIRTARLRFRE